MRPPQVWHRFVDVAGVKVFYRETEPEQTGPEQTGPAGGLPVLLLHGFPTASHQYRRLMHTLGSRHRLIAPDYPGFGHTEAPEGFPYSFDSLAEVIDGFVRTLGLTRFVLYMFDFGAPVGFRVATGHTGAEIAGLIVQNANAYEEGLSGTARHFIHHATAEQVRGELLTLAATRGQYEQGVSDPSLVDPDSWTLDQHLLDRPGRADAQVALALDYHTNLGRYPQWQDWLREHCPPALITWGRGDPFFTEAGARAYLRDLPDAELHLFDTGHFALEEKLPEIAPLVSAFLNRL